MPKPATLALCAATLMGSMLLVAVPSRRGGAQPGAPVPNIGRYQIMQSSNNACFVIDTTTGQTWSRVGMSWTDLGSPAMPKR